MLTEGVKTLLRYLPFNVIRKEKKKEYTDIVIKIIILFYFKLKKLWY